MKILVKPAFFLACVQMVTSVAYAGQEAKEVRVAKGLEKKLVSMKSTEPLKVLIRVRHDIDDSELTETAHASGGNWHDGYHPVTVNGAALSGNEVEALNGKSVERNRLLDEKKKKRTTDVIAKLEKNLEGKSFPRGWT